jgi:hypothetical protein
MNDVSLTFSQPNPFPSQPAQGLLHGDAASASEIAHGSSPDHRADIARLLFDSDVWPFESVGEVALRVVSKVAARWS